MCAISATPAPAPVDERVLWRLVKDGKVAEAAVRRIEGAGYDLRYSWNGELRASQLYKDLATLDAAAETMRRELQRRG